MNSKKLIKSFGYAIEGIIAAMREQNVKIHICSAIVVIVMGVLTGLSGIEWAIIIVVIAGMITAEMLNTAIERVVDLVTPDFHPLAKQAKDIAAGAVFVFALASVIIGLLIFLPKWVNFL